MARALLLVVVGVIAATELAWLLLGGDAGPIGSALAELALTLSFAVFAWRPPAGALVLVASAGATVLVGTGMLGALVLVVGAGLVVATCSSAVIVGYALSAGVVCGAVIMLAPASGASEDAATLAVVATLSSAAGLYLRWLRGRASALESALVEQDRAREIATQIERDRIADELHDLIAHELTIIAMHAQVLRRTDEPASRQLAEGAIADAARKALADIRRVLRVAAMSRSDEPDVDSIRNQLGVSLEDVRSQIETAGGELLVEGSAGTLPPSIDTALGRIVREATSNVLKHGGAGAPVTISLGRADGRVRLRVRNGRGGSPRALELPTGGYGIARMRARAEALGGAFEAGPAGEGWTIEVSLPAG
ncbi:histidine kinase [Agrococcus sp. SL85]|uniref:sensor histidine kinase n=1 Tax=Agrococcus sp. SL85 TaxID=2995141 RepID=UPI00226CFECD|nr:histidine kinase [Agrococcus sp. SL85]WAC65140.1 histidine kinase [Agrococcus sp. SL85]